MPARAELTRCDGTVQMNLLCRNTQFLLQSLDKPHQMLHLSIAEGPTLAIAHQADSDRMLVVVCST